MLHAFLALTTFLVCLPFLFDLFPISGAHVVLSIISFVCYVPQIIKLYQTKNSEGISLSLYFLVIVGSGLLMVVAWKSKDFGLLSSVGSLAIMRTIVFCQANHYQSKAS